MMFRFLRSFSMLPYRKKINAKVIVEHRSTRNNLCCEKVLLSTIFGMVSHIEVINYHTTFSHISYLIGMWRFMSYREEYLWQRSKLKCMANFYKVIRNLKLNFTHHFVALLEHFIIIPFFASLLVFFLRNRFILIVWKIFSFMAEAEKIGHCVTHEFSFVLLLCFSF